MFSLKTTATTAASGFPSASLVLLVWGTTLLLLNGVQGQTPAQDCETANLIWTKMGGKSSLVSTTSCCNTTSPYGFQFINCSPTRITELLWSGYGLKNSIPTEIGNLVGLTYLGLSTNSLNGSIPSTIGNLVNLKTLDLGFNRLNSIPSTIGNLVSLQNLYLNDNQLTGAIPSTMGNLVNLQYNVLLANNKLSGAIPSFWGNLTKIASLDLSNNSFTGAIPDNLGDLVNLQQFFLNDNKLSGPIPSSFGNFTKVTYLDLHNNQLSGPIPSSLGNLISVKRLYLFQNRLNGTIPTSLGNLNNLTTLLLYNNELTGYPSSLNLSRILQVQLFPNPMSTVPFDKVVNVSSILLTNVTWTTFLSTPVALKKRDQTSSSGVVSVNDLLAQCNINNVQQMPAGCIAGIFQKYCTTPSNWTSLQICQSSYNTAFSNSIFSSLGAACPAWKYGPKSSNCGSAVSAFSYKYVVDSTNYIQLNATHASQLVGTIFASQTYAPCNPNLQTCKWT